MFDELIELLQIPVTGMMAISGHLTDKAGEIASEIVKEDK